VDETVPARPACLQLSPQGTDVNLHEVEIRAGTVDTDTLTSSGFTPAQLQAVQTVLANTKRALAPSVP
jgi:hypothetical protein